ncbi:MAG: hypothetical protein WBV61_06930 [Rhodanobacteraceae bacterium]
MLTRLIVALVLSVGLSAAGFALSHRSGPSVPEPVHHAAQSKPARATLPVLPIVEVHPGTEELEAAAMTTLPQILVHPGPRELSNAATRTQAEARVAASVAAAITPLHASTATTSVPHAPLDMPYYSFGKSAPRMSRE